MLKKILVSAAVLTAVTRIQPEPSDTMVPRAAKKGFPS